MTKGENSCGLLCICIYGKHFAALMGFVNKITYIENIYLPPLTPRIVQQGAVEPHRYADKPKPNWKWPCTCFCGAPTLKLFWLPCPVSATSVRKRISGVGWMKYRCTTSCPTITHSWNLPLSAIWCQQVNMDNVVVFYSVCLESHDICVRSLRMYLRWLLSNTGLIQKAYLKFFSAQVRWK